MNPRYFKKLIHLFRYGFISPIWSYIAPIIIKVSGPRTAAYLSYKSIDWGEMNHEKTILCLQRESFVKDIIELRKRSNYNYPMIAGGFTRFQMVWFPIEMQIQTFYKLHQKKNNKAVTLAAEYATHLILLVSKKHSVQAILSANFDYWQDAGFKIACKKLGIPFLVLSREHPVIPKVCDEGVNWYKESAYHFEGAAIAVAGHSTKDVIMKVDTICKPEQITITGLPRYDAWLDVDTSNALEDRPFVTLLTFTEGYYADETFEEVLQLFCNAAELHVNKDVSFLVKTKDAEDTHNVKKMMAEKGLSGLDLECSHEKDLFDVLPKSRMVINYNSLSLVEAVMAKARVVIPIWGQCKDSGEEAMYVSDNPHISKVVEFAYGSDDLLEIIASCVTGCAHEISDEEIRDFLGEYIHIPTHGNYCDEFESFVTSLIKIKD
jgi:hypothetical protein